MNKALKKRLPNYFLFWFTQLLVIGAITYAISDKTLVARIPSQYYSNLIQRIFGIYGLLLLSEQIFVGAFKLKLQKRFKNILEFHLIQGKVVYAVIITHALAFLLYRYFFTGKINPFYIFTDFCLICPNKLELFISLGRISLIAFSFTIFAAVFRNFGLLIENWRYIHILNYPIFFLVSLHAYFVGSDTLKFPIKYIYYVVNIIVIVAFVYKILPFVKRFRIS